VNNTCCGSASCPSGQRCDITNSPGVCTALQGPGGTCGKDTDCTTNNCDPNFSTCGAVKTVTPTPTQTPRDPGAICGSASQCPDGYFCSTDEHVCCTSSSCPTDETCKGTGDCAPLPTPTPTKPQGGSTCDPTDPNGCADGLFCTDNVCCDSDTCVDPDRCDIFGSTGSCSPPLLEGDQCAQNTDCEDPLICTFNPVSSRYECTAPPDPTPTIIPFTPVFTPLPPVVNESRSGGCSIGHGPDNGSQLWVFGVLPLALWLRRRRLQRVRLRNDECRRR
jgi:hypothetical protein